MAFTAAAVLLLLAALPRLAASGLGFLPVQDQQDDNCVDSVECPLDGCCGFEGTCCGGHCAKYEDDCCESGTGAEVCYGNGAGESTCYVDSGGASDCCLKNTGFVCPLKANNRGTCCETFAQCCDIDSTDGCCAGTCVQCNHFACSESAYQASWPCAPTCPANSTWIQGANGTIICSCFPGSQGVNCATPTPFPWMYHVNIDATTPAIPGIGLGGQGCASVGIDAPACCLQMYVQGSSTCLHSAFPPALLTTSMWSNGTCAPLFEKVANETVYCAGSNSVAAVLVFV